MSEEKKCDRCGGTKLSSMKILDSRTAKTFEVIKCETCGHQRWAKVDDEHRG
jgi:hypothetical protein